MMRIRGARTLACLGVLTLLATVAAARDRQPATTPAISSVSRVTGPRVIGERSGALATRDGLELTLTADTGNIHIFTDATGTLRYAARVEAEAGDQAATLVKEFSLTARTNARGIVLAGHMPKLRDAERVWVTYEVHVPRQYNLKVSTQAGDITTQDIDGTVALSTGGGNIEAGRIGVPGGQTQEKSAEFVALLNTAGGHITAGDVAGGLRATTGGGHINVGDIAGEAVLRSGGGDLHAGRLGGLAQLTTGGGNIVATSADAGVDAESAGGRIEFGEVAGAVDIRTGGGGVRIARLAGPTEIDSRDGGLTLAGVNVPVRASALAGGVTAWLSPEFGRGERTNSVVPSGAASPGTAPSGASSVGHGLRAMRGTGAAPDLQNLSEITSGQGDITVYVPHDIALTIDALIEPGSGGRITADPALPLRTTDEHGLDAATRHAHCALNGGGQVLHLRTAGNIQLRLLDASAERRLAQLQSEALAQRAENHERNAPMAPETKASVHDASIAAQVSPGEGANGQTDRANGRSNNLRNGNSWWHGSWWQDFWWGGVRVDPDEEQKRLSHAVAPEYPEAARQAGIEGDVSLRVIIGPDGAVNGIRLLSGDPALARAAMESVAQWRYAPALLDGWPVSVVTTVTLAFRLH